MDLSKIKNLINSRLIKNYISLSVVQGANFIIPLIILPYLVRTLGTKTFGLVMFAQAFILFFNVIVDFGFSLSGVRAISLNRDNHKIIEETFNAIICIKLVLIIISFLILFLIVNIFSRFTSSKTLYYVTFGWIVGQALFPIWFYQGVEKMKYITIFKIMAQMITLIAIIIFVKNSNDYLLVPLFNSIGFIVVGLFSIKKILKDYKFKFYIPKPFVLYKYLNESFSFFVSRIAVSIYTSSNAFVLGLFTNNTMVGYYSVSEKMYIALQALYMPIVGVLYPFMAKERNVKLFKKIFKFVVFLNIILIISLYFFTPFLVELIAGQIFLESVLVFRIFLIVSIIVVPSIIIGYPFLAALGHQNFANFSVTIASLVHLVGLLVLAYFRLINIYSIVFLLILTQSTDLLIRVVGTIRNNLWRIGEVV